MKYETYFFYAPQFVYACENIGGPATYGLWLLQRPRRCLSISLTLYQLIGINLNFCYLDFTYSKLLRSFHKYLHQSKYIALSQTDVCMDLVDGTPKLNLKPTTIIQSLTVSINAIGDICDPSSYDILCIYIYIYIYIRKLVSMQLTIFDETILTD